MAANTGVATRRLFAEVAHVELATDLQADDEEEQGDQPVVDPVAEVERQFLGAKAE